MDRLPFEQQFLLVVQAAALAGLCARLAWTGLYHKYRYFLAYLIFSLIQLITVPFLPLSSIIYLRVWMASETLAMCAYALVVLETYALILKDLPGIASAARRYLNVSLALAVLASLLLLGIERTPVRAAEYFLVCERTVISTLLVFVISSLAFLVYYPVPISRNIIFYSIGFAVYLLTKTMTLLVNNLRYPWLYRSINSALIAIAAACPLFWLLVLSVKGEAKTMVIGHRWTPEDEKRVLSRLRSINDSLARAVRK